MENSLSKRSSDGEFFAQAMEYMNKKMKTTSSDDDQLRRLTELKSTIISVDDDRHRRRRRFLSNPATMKLSPFTLPSQRLLAEEEFSSDRFVTTSSPFTVPPHRPLADKEFCSDGDSSDEYESSELDVEEDDASGLVDLEVNSHETETKTSSSICNNKFRERKTTPRSRLTEESMAEAPKATNPTNQSSPPPPPPPPAPAAADQVQQNQMPSHDEIEDFFVTVEKEQQKRFKEKYNFDVVKDMPLEGRYQWVRLK
ncbi:Cyclin-dependent kinase inhibitor 7 [Linum perenne]